MSCRMRVPAKAVLMAAGVMVLGVSVAEAAPSGSAARSSGAATAPKPAAPKGVSPKAAEPPVAPPAAAAQADAQAGPFDLAAAVAKSNAYIELMNRTLRAVESWGRYTSWVDVKKGPTGKERYIDYGLYSLYDVKDEIAKARGVIGTPPATPDLDAAFSRYIEAYDVLAPLITAAEGYYERRDYKSDNMAEGKALHAKMAPAAEAFLKARAEVEALMRVFKRDTDTRSLAALAAKEGEGPGWHIKTVMMHAQDVIEQLPQGDKPADMKAFDAALDAYAKTVRAYDAYAQANPGKLSSFESEPRSLLGKLRDFRDKLAKSKGRVRDPFVNMDLTFLISQYNMMISSSQMATRFGR